MSCRNSPSFKSPRPAGSVMRRFVLPFSIARRGESGTGCLLSGGRSKGSSPRAASRVRDFQAEQPSFAGAGGRRDASRCARLDFGGRLACTGRGASLRPGSGQIAERHLEHTLLTNALPIEARGHRTKPSQRRCESEMTAPQRRSALRQFLLPATKVLR